MSSHPTFKNYPLELLQPTFDSPLVDISVELEHLRRTQASLAFEDFCFSQTERIKKILGIAGIYTEIGAMTLKSGKSGAQLDLVLRRRDRIVNLCEIKFTQREFLVTKSVEENIRKKMTTLSTHLGKTEAIHPVLIAPFGIKKNEHASIFHRVITLEDLMHD